MSSTPEMSFQMLHRIKGSYPEFPDNWSVISILETTALEKDSVIRNFRLTSGDELECEATIKRYLMVQTDNFKG